MTVRKTLTILSAAAFLCGGVFVGGASAQFFDMDDDPWASPADEPASSSGSSSGGDGWSLGDDSQQTQETAPTGMPASATKGVKPAKPPKPSKEPRAASEGMVNIFGNVGASFGIGGYLVGASDEYKGNSNTGTIIKSKDHYINVGQGLRLETGAGIAAMPDVEVRVSADFNFGLFAPKVETTSDVSGGSERVRNITDYDYFMWGFKVMAVPQFEVFELFDMYTGAGVRLGFASVSHKDTVDRPVMGEAHYQWNMSTGIGFCGVIGTLLPFSDAMSLFAEVQFESMNFNLKKKELKTYSPSSGGETPLRGETEGYEKNSTIAEAPWKIPAANWGLRFGIKYWVM